MGGTVAYGGRVNGASKLWALLKANPTETPGGLGGERGPPPHTKLGLASSGPSPMQGRAYHRDQVPKPIPQHKKTSKLRASVFLNDSDCRVAGSPVNMSY